MQIGDRVRLIRKTDYAVFCGVGTVEKLTATRVSVRFDSFANLGSGQRRIRSYRPASLEIVSWAHRAVTPGQHETEGGR